MEKEKRKRKKKEQSTGSLMWMKNERMKYDDASDHSLK